MNTVLKRVLAVAAIKKGYDAVQKRRQPKRSKKVLALPLLALVAGTGYAAFRAYSARTTGSVAAGTAPERSDRQEDREIRLEDTMTEARR